MPSFSCLVGWVDRPLIRPGFAGPPSPQGEGFETAAFPSAKPPHTRPAGGRAMGVRYRAAGQAEKRENPRRVPNQKGGSGGRTSSSWCSFLRLSSKESRPRRSRRGPRALRPEAASEPPTRRVRSTAPQKINLQTSIFNSIIKAVENQEFYASATEVQDYAE